MIGQVDANTRQTAKNLRKQGLSIREIASRLGRSKTCVGEWLKGVKPGQSESVKINPPSYTHQPSPGARTGVTQGQDRTLGHTKGQPSTTQDNRTGSKRGSKPPLLFQGQTVRPKPLSGWYALLVIALVIGASLAYVLFTRWWNDEPVFGFVLGKKAEKTPNPEKTYGFEGESVEDLIESEGFGDYEDKDRANPEGDIPEII